MDEWRGLGFTVQGSVFGVRGLGLARESKDAMQALHSRCGWETSCTIVWRKREGETAKKPDGAGEKIIVWGVGTPVDAHRGGPIKGHIEGPAVCGHNYCRCEPGKCACLVPLTDPGEERAGHVWKRKAGDDDARALDKGEGACVV